MSEAVQVAIISGLCVAVPNILVLISSNKKNTDIIKYRIDELEANVHELNQVIDRVYKAESEIKVLKEKVKNEQ